ncbi:MAG TPA: hypothetical protein VMW34_08920 [Anaerolineales bacterium]|nr:hypothetical protein [Anaerolineales bacterium]
MDGWDCEPEDLDGYEIYHILVPAKGTSVAGICHVRGENVDIPVVWLIYIAVENGKKRPIILKD